MLEAALENAKKPQDANQKSGSQHPSTDLDKLVLVLMAIKPHH